MADIKFYRGLKAKYNPTKHKDGLYFATDKKELILNGQTYGCEVDDEVLSNGINPVTGRAIYKAIQDTVAAQIANTAIGTKLLLAKTGNAYRVELYDSRTNALLSQTAGFIGGEGTADMSGLSLQWLHGDLYAKYGETALVKFKYDVLNSSGYSTGTPGKAKLTIKNTSNNTTIAIIEKDLVAGEICTTDVTEYLIEGSSITIQIEVEADVPNKGIQTEQYSCKAFLVSINLLDENFDIAIATPKGSKIRIPFTVEGSNVQKKVKCWLNGTLVDEKATFTQGSFEVETDNLNHGSHAVQIRAEYAVDEITTIYSNSIYYSLAVVEPGVSTPVIATRSNYSDGSLVIGVPTFNMEQYDSYTLAYAVYDPNNVTAEVEFYSDNEFISSNNTLFTRDTFTYRYTTSGTKECKVKSGAAEFIYRVNVNPSTLNVDEPVDNLDLYLDAYGKSNNSDNRASWSFNGITTDFENVNFGGDGWVNNALRLMNGGKATINFKPLSPKSTGANNAFAFTVRFRVNNVINDSDEIIKCVDPSGTGFIITTQEAKFVTNSGNKVSTKFASGETYNIAFVSYPIATTTSGNDTKINSSMIYLYVNGILSGAAIRDTSDNIYQSLPQNIVLEAANCTLDIYSIRSYSAQLTSSQIFSCYIIDLGDSQSFKSEYEDNNVLDFNNNVSVTSVHGKIPYCIVTGKQDNGTPTLLHAAVYNDKNIKYNVDSILYVDGAHPEFNFNCVPGENGNPQISLQGTSSLAYPRKNYKLRLKSGDLYLGCDAEGNGGEKQKKPKYAMSVSAAPVHTFCIKADFAESSSSHNTGLANMVQEVLANAGDLTPAQKYVDKDQYPYEVRTTVQGHPMLLFYRATMADTPVFAGKYNFNNDKSTENVFGFTEIPGYHDLPEVVALKDAKAADALQQITDLGISFRDKDGVATTKNPFEEFDFTECWEFKNNSQVMGWFKEADFDKKEIDEKGKETYKWLLTWESRYPDDDSVNNAYKDGVKPTYLMRLVKWVNSTDTEQATNEKLVENVTYSGVIYSHDTPEYRKAKFKAELKDYFDINFLCDYYMINDAVAGVDQRVKNMMFAFWYDPEYVGPGDGVLCYPIYYDNDTILGVRNDGRNVFNWDIDEESLDPTEDPSKKVYAFAGHESVLWKNLRDSFQDELAAAYVRIRVDNMTNDRMYYWFDDTQSSKYCENLYNEDAKYKYIVPATQGVDVTVDGVTNTQFYKYDYSAQGDRKAHRHWFISNRMDLFDARFDTGNYKVTKIQAKGVSSYGYNILRATAARDYYFQASSDEAGTTHVKVNAGETWEYKYNADMAIGSTFNFYGGKWMSKLDMSEWNGFGVLDIGTLPVLEEFILGNPTWVNSALNSSPISNNMPLVKKVQIINCKSIPSFNFSSCNYLEEVDLTGCDGTTAVTFAQGGSINYVKYPANIQKVDLQSLSKLHTYGINFDNIASVKYLRVENCPNIDGLSLLNKMLNTSGTAIKFVRITGLSMNGDGSDLIKYMNSKIGGITVNGTDDLEHCRLAGKYKLTTLLDDDVYASLVSYFPELEISQPTYTTIKFNSRQNTTEKISNLDNHTGHDYGNDYEPSGYLLKIFSQRKSYLVKQDLSGEKGSFVACEISASNNKYFKDGAEAKLDGSYGDLCMYEPDYWYKGVNDHKKGVIYAMYSTLSSAPTNPVGKKVAISDCEVTPGYAINATDLYDTISEAKVANSSYKLVHYTLPTSHNYNQFRVTTVSSNYLGCVVSDSKGKILLKLKASDGTGMFNGSYLFDTLPAKATDIYFTMTEDDNYNINSYCLWLTESEDIEAIEPDWVFHRYQFNGKLLSAPYNDSVNSAIYPNIDQYGRYSKAGNAMSVKEMSNYVKNRGIGYNPFGYEEYKDILMLAYAFYGTTALHSKKVGTGRSDNADYNQLYNSSYFPNFVDYTEYGDADTITNGEDYVSYYTDDRIIPGIATLMGYFQFIGQGSTMSSNDIVERSKMLYSNSVNGRKVKLFSTSSVKYGLNIQGGRYLDLFGTGESSSGTSTTGYCVAEDMEGNSSSPGFLEIGYQGYQNPGSVASCRMRVTLSTASAVITDWTLQRILRISIVPTSVTFVNNSSEYIAL